MACCLFGRSSSSASSRMFNNVRVVDLNGFVEEFDYPVTVSQVTGCPQKHFVFTAAQLLSASLKSLSPETLLEPGHIYFLLPSSAFRNEISAIDLAALVKKLTAKAKSVGKSEGNNSPGRTSLLRSPYSPSSSSPQWKSSPARSPIRMANYGGVEKFPSEKRSWTPILDTIREMSFRKSHSDLQ